MKYFQPVLCLSFFAFAQTAAAQLTNATADDIGLSQLRAANPGLTEGVGVKAHLVEAFNPSTTDDFVPNVNDAQLSGNSINIVDPPVTPGSANSSHALDSARHFFGSNGVARDLGTGGLDIDVYAAINSNSPGTDWVNGLVNGFANGLVNGRDPDLSQFDRSTVSSHSYIFNANTSSTALPLADQQAQFVNPLQRLDYIINETDTTTVVGTANSGSLPLGWTPAYNTIAVGLSSGTHAAGLTTFNGAGRVAIDVVAPEPNSSTATPVVAGAVAILQDAADGSDASRSEVIRATILAGATKDVGDINGTWSRTTTQPLDLIFGAGELNVLNSYNIQQGGEVNGGTAANPGVISDLNGWDYEENLQTNDERFYEFSIGAGDELEELSIVLAWNLNIIDTTEGFFGDFNFTPIEQLANLSLELFDSAGNLVDASLSSVDNVEHIYIPVGSGLTDGTYQLRVSNNNEFATDFGLAFRGSFVPTASSVPEPGSVLALSALMGMFLARRRRVG